MISLLGKQTPHIQKNTSQTLPAYNQWGPLFFLEKALFWGVDLQNRGHPGSRYILKLSRTSSALQSMSQTPKQSQLSGQCVWGSSHGISTWQRFAVKKRYVRKSGGNNPGGGCHWAGDRSKLFLNVFNLVCLQPPNSKEENTTLLAILLVSFLGWLSDPFKGCWRPPRIGDQSKGHKLNDLAMNLSYCWWQKSGDHQLRLVVYPIIYQVLAPSNPSTVSGLSPFSHILWILISPGAEDALVRRDGDPRATQISLSSDGHLTVVRHLWWWSEPGRWAMGWPKGLGFI